MVLFASKRRSKNVLQLNIRYSHINIKQHSQVTYLRWVLDERMSSEPMALKIINKINGKLKLRLTGKIDISQNSFAECSAMFLFSHTLIMRLQPGTLISMKNRKKKIQIMQNKFIRFCLKLDKMHHISEEEFKLINWLPTSKRVDQCINTITYNFVNNTCPYYLNEIFDFSPYCRISTRNNFSKLKNPFRKTNMGQKAISYIGPSIWNSLPDSIKRANSLNTFKHNVKKHYLT